MYVFLFFFFFKQKTAYEMRISDWSSDVCSSDLRPLFATQAQTWLCEAKCREFPGQHTTAEVPRRREFPTMSTMRLMCVAPDAQLLIPTLFNPQCKGI